jgi:hypothetical protein
MRLEFRQAVEMADPVIADGLVDQRAAPDCRTEASAAA